MKVILTEAFGEVGREVWTSLDGAGADVFLFSSTLKIKDERNYINELIEFQKKTGAEMIIPIFFPEAIARHSDEFPGVIIPIDSEKNIIALDDKLSALSIAERLGIPQPKRYPDVSSVDHYPVVFKRTGGHGGDSVYFPKRRESLEHLAGASVPGKYLITEEIDGIDVCVDAIRWGDFFYGAAYKVLLPRAKGVSILRESVDAPELVSKAKALMDEVGYRGVCGFDFRIDRKGRVWFLESNPRFSGGVASQIRSGFDVPAILFKLALGESPEAIDFKPGVITRNDEEIRTYLKRRLRQRKLDLKDLALAYFKK